MCYCIEKRSSFISHRTDRPYYFSAFYILIGFHSLRLSTCQRKNDGKFGFLYLNAAPD